MTDYSLYVVTDKKVSNGKTHAQIAKEAIRGGATIIQMRDKDMSDKEFYAAAKDVASYCWGCGVPFIINDRLDIAMLCGADGIHLGQDDMPVSEVREFVPREFIIGVSVSSVEEALEAQKNGADYLAVSPVFDTSSKDDAGSGLGLELLQDIDRATFLPVVAIGGINADNIGDVIGTGISGAAVISAVVGQPDICEAAANLKRKIIEVRGCLSQPHGPFETL